MKGFSIQTEIEEYSSFEEYVKEAFCMILKCWKKTVEAGGEDAWKKYAADFLKASNMAGIGFG